MQGRWLRSFLHKIFSFLPNDRQSFMTVRHPCLPAGRLERWKSHSIPLLPVFDRKKITKGDVTPPFRKGRRRRPEPQYLRKRGSGTLAPDGGEGFNKAIFWTIRTFPSDPIPSSDLPTKNSILTGRPGSEAPRSKALLFKKELQEYYTLRKSRMGRFVNHIYHVTHWNHTKYACEKKYFDLLKNEYYI